MEYVQKRDKCLCGGSVRNDEGDDAMIVDVGRMFPEGKTAEVASGISRRPHIGSRQKEGRKLQPLN